MSNDPIAGSTYTPVAQLERGILVCPRCKAPARRVERQVACCAKPLCMTRKESPDA